MEAIAWHEYTITALLMLYVIFRGLLVRKEEWEWEGKTKGMWNETCIL